MVSEPRRGTSIVPLALHWVGMLPDLPVLVAMPHHAYLPLGAAHSAAHTPPCCQSG